MTLIKFNEFSFSPFTDLGARVWNDEYILAMSVCVCMLSLRDFHKFPFTSFILMTFQRRHYFQLQSSGKHSSYRQLIPPKITLNGDGCKGNSPSLLMYFKSFACILSDSSSAVSVIMGKSINLLKPKGISICHIQTQTNNQFFNWMWNHAEVPLSTAFKQIFSSEEKWWFKLYICNTYSLAWLDYSPAIPSVLIFHIFFYFYYSVSEYRS